MEIDGAFMPGCVEQLVLEHNFPPPIKSNNTATGELMLKQSAPTYPPPPQSILMPGYTTPSSTGLSDCQVDEKCKCVRFCFLGTVRPSRGAVVGVFRKRWLCFEERSEEGRGSGRGERVGGGRGWGFGWPLTSEGEKCVH